MINKHFAIVSVKYLKAKAIFLNIKMVCRKIVILICTIGFIIHSIACFYKEIASQKKAVDVTPVDLSSIHFPLLFGISINPGSLNLEDKDP